MPSIERDAFVRMIELGPPRPGETLLAPVGVRLLADHLTPVAAYRSLVAPDERTAPSYLLESVENGDRQGRYSILSAQPSMEVVARAHDVTVHDRRTGESRTTREDDPLDTPRRIARTWRYAAPDPDDPRARLLPTCALGGWCGWASYDTVRYTEPEKLDPRNAPPDDRAIPDLHIAWYDGVVVFDHVEKIVHVVRLGRVEHGADPGAAWDQAMGAIGAVVAALNTPRVRLPIGRVEQGASIEPPPPSNITREQHRAMVERAKEYIRAGDIFQVVLGQRFERVSDADPFDVYRALRAVNPSPYMVYMQGEGCILIASSPEILCRVRPAPETPGGPMVVTNRPLAGTRRRGATPAEDARLEAELLADDKDRAEHIMLVDLGRNDVGRVAKPGTVRLERVMEIERYSHVMHISSTVTGELREGLDCWDALRAALPVGTISGAPKVRAMQIIDELEPVRRGPYGGGMGYVAPDGRMDIALALRTIVAPTALRNGARWTYHLQAAGGVVADSQPDAEYDETVNKAAALARAIDVAERAFGANA